MDIGLKQLEKIVIEGIEITINGRDLILTCKNHVDIISATGENGKSIKSRELKIKNVTFSEF